MICSGDHNVNVLVDRSSETGGGGPPGRILSGLSQNPYFPYGSTAELIRDTTDTNQRVLSNLCKVHLYTAMAASSAQNVSSSNSPAERRAACGSVRRGRGWPRGFT
eukprot:COSAG01_NODE_6259_length_3766_cov_22.191462_1_plen_106_part_00